MSHHFSISSYCGSCASIIKQKFSQLENAPKELYINFCLKFGESYGYFTLSQILVIYLHEEFGISDLQSGAIYGLWGAAITFWSFITSCFNDYLGVRRSLLLGFTVSMFSNIAIALCTNINVMFVILFAILPIGNSIGIPMLSVGIKRYTTRRNRGFAYGVFYAVMNVAALASGPVIDFFNVVVCPSQSDCSSTYRQHLVGTTASNSKEAMRLVTGNRLTIWTIVVVYVFAWCITYFYLREIKVVDEEEEDQATPAPATTVVEGGGTPVRDLEKNDPLSASQNNNVMIHRRGTHKQKRIKEKENNQVLVYSSLHVIDEDEAEHSREEETGIEMRHHNYAQLTAQDSAHGEEPQLTNSNLSHSPSPRHSHSHILDREDEDDAASETSLSPLYSPVNGSGDRNEQSSTVRDRRGDSDNPIHRNDNYRHSEERGARIEGDPHNHNNTNNTNVNNVNNGDGAAAVSATPKIFSSYHFVLEVVSTPTFWRFCVLTLFLINLNTIFRHMDATLPTYLIRVFGDNYPKGLIYSINPFMIIWLTPTVAAFTSHWPHFDMIKYGGYVSALSPFFMAFSTSTWAVVMFMVLLSLGEAVWSPRFYDYTMSVAPEGREASFSALSTLPLFAAKIPVGLLSGYLISTYLPEDHGSRSEHARNGEKLWLIIGLLTLSSPILITVFEKCIREPDKKKRVAPSTDNLNNSGNGSDPVREDISSPIHTHHMHSDNESRREIEIQEEKQGEERTDIVMV